jgi:hypothetical protein
MTWVTWRQSRIEMFIFAAALAAVAMFLIWTGLDIRSHFDSLGIASCLANDEPSGTCEQAIESFSNRVNDFTNLANWFVLFPALAGVLVAAPLVLDLEQGTYRLGWTQGVTRTRWLAVKIATGVAILTVVSLALVVLWRWWGKPLFSSDEQLVMSQWDATIFDSRAVLISYTVFAFALCVAVGSIFRRSIAAFGIALVGFVGVRVLIETEFREGFLTPLKSMNDALTPRGDFGRGAWVIESGPSDKYGNLLPWNDPVVQECFGIKRVLAEAPSPEQVNAAMEAQTRCIRDHDIYMTTIYHPASRFWIFQGIESAIFLGLSAILLGLTFYWVTRRIAR